MQLQESDDTESRVISRIKGRMKDILRFKPTMKNITSSVKMKEYLRSHYEYFTGQAM